MNVICYRLTEHRFALFTSYKDSIQSSIELFSGHDGLAEETRLPRKATCLSITGALALLGDKHGHLTFWSLEETRVVFHVANAHQVAVESVAIKGEFAFSLAKDEDIKVWKLTKMDNSHTLAFEGKKI